MFELPHFSQLKEAKGVLVTGAGGGFDVYGAIPLFLGLQNAGVNTYLGSYTFTALDLIDADSINNKCKIINKNTNLTKYVKYSPEKFIVDWFDQNKNQDVPIYSYHGGPKQLTKTFDQLSLKLKLDTVIIVDGGTDALMRGDEVHLGTPAEDVASIIGAVNSSIPHEYLVISGFGVEHSIPQEENMKAIAELCKNGGYLGAQSLLKDMDEVKVYCKIVDYANSELPEHKSIVQNSIVDSIKGEVGNYHSLKRTKGSILDINFLMSTYLWCDLQSVYDRLLYKDEVNDAKSIHDMNVAIRKYRQKQLGR